MTERTDHDHGLRKPIDVYVGSRLRAARQRTGYSAEAMANRLGLEPAAYRDAEEGRRRLGAMELLACAELTGVNFSWFFDGLSSRNEGKETKPAGRTGSAEIIQFRRRESQE
jgi:transcriptional regulator with XRE-family HTH domain